MKFDTSDSIDGGVGYDTARFQGTQAVTLDLSATNIEVAYGASGDDTFTNSSTGSVEMHRQGGNDTLTGGIGHESFYGEDGNDTINATAGNDILDGGAGDDSLDGGDGNDTLTGGAGADTLTGGAGNDILNFDYLDTINWSLD